MDHVRIGEPWCTDNIDGPYNTDVICRDWKTHFYFFHFSFFLLLFCYFIVLRLSASSLVCFFISFIVN